MSEDRTVHSDELPVTMQSLVDELRSLGLGRNDRVIVHSSLSSLGWVSGGPMAVILALEEVLGFGGTLVMAAHSGDLSEPSYWQHPPVPEHWWPVIRETMPPFMPDLTKTRGIGVIPEVFRKQDGVYRSTHPQLSFCAWGADARTVVSHHALAYPLGEGSPLCELYKLDAKVLLLGVDYGSNTSLHLAEYRAVWPGKKRILQGAPIMEKGKRVWKTWEDFEVDTDDFNALGADFEQTGKFQTGSIGKAQARIMRVRDLVDFGTEWFALNRGRITQ